MINEGKKVKILKRLLYLSIVLFAVLIVSTTSIAYFTFKKVYEGDGNLPKLNLYYSVSGATTDVLRNISYNGQASNSITVKLNTMENNVSGYVRAKVAIYWSNSLNNTPYDDNNKLVIACEVLNSNAENANLWEFKNGYFYLKEPMEKDTEVTLFDTIKFAENITAYRGERVSLIIIAEIYQTTNLPENW
jgi:hypothetical protein